MPGTTIKDALAKWKAEHEQEPAEAEEISLIFRMPPIDKMDTSLLVLTNCVKLVLSTNAIDKIANLNGLKSLKILSLSRNNIKNLNGLEAVGDTLEQLWLSYNNIEKMKGILVLKNLKILYLTNNNVKDWGEFSKLGDLPELKELNFLNNPLEIKHRDDGDWSEKVAKLCVSLKKLDGCAILREE